MPRHLTVPSSANVMRLLITCLVPGALVACRDTTEPTFTKRVPKLAASHEAVLGTFSAPIPGTNEEGNALVSTGIEIPDGVEVRVTVSGFLRYSDNPGWPPACPPRGPVPDGLNPLGPIGFPDPPDGGGAFPSGHAAQVSLRGEVVQLQPRDATLETVSGTTTGPGILWFSRPAGFPGSCADQQSSGAAYLVSGTQMVTVEAIVPVSIEVVCTGSGSTRGSTVPCEARPQPSDQALVVTGWTFTSATGDVVTRSTSDQTWTGQLVVDGRIDVTGTVAGHAAMGSTSVTVTARDWGSKTVRDNLTTPGPDGLPIRPTAFEGQLGVTSLHLRVRQDLSNYAALIADGGPNNGFWYMTDIPFETFDTARVNYPPMTQGSDWYLIQYPKDRRVGGIAYCGQPRVLTLRPLVEAHEGTAPANQPNSHVGIFINDVERDARVKPERLAGANPDPEPTRAEIETTAFNDSKAMDTDSRNNINSSTLPCVFTYDYSRLP